MYEIYPGYYGYERFYISEGYVDEVTYFSDGGNKQFSGLHGGIVGQGPVENANFSLILGNNSDTYLSFYDNNSIILTITNDVIVDNDGDDLYFNLYENSSVHANVSVSFNGSYFVFLGELNDTTSSFDLSNIDFDLPVRFVRLHFTVIWMSTMTDVTRNIISILDMTIYHILHHMLTIQIQILYILYLYISVVFILVVTHIVTG